METPHLIKNGFQWRICMINPKKANSIPPNRMLLVNDAAELFFQKEYSEDRSSVSVSFAINGIGLNLGPVRNYRICVDEIVELTPANVGQYRFEKIIGEYTKFLEMAKLDADGHEISKAPSIIVPPQSFLVKGRS